MMSIGFLTFGGASSGFVLNNYASNDILASFARLAIGLALVTSFPFTFRALKDGVMDLLKLTPEKRETYNQSFTVGLIGLVTLLATILKDVGFVNSISGAVFGSAIMFIIPALLNLSNSKRASANGTTTGKIGGSETLLNKGMIAGGILMGGIGFVISTLRQLGKL